MDSWPSAFSKKTRNADQIGCLFREEAEKEAALHKSATGRREKVEYVGDSLAGKIRTMHQRFQLLIALSYIYGLLF